MKKENEMKRMNKGITTLLALMMATTAVLTACGQTVEEAGEEEKTGEETVMEPVEEGEEPLAEEDLEGVLTGVEDHYVLQDAKDVDYMHDVSYDETVEMSGNDSNSEKSENDVKNSRIIDSVTADSSKVDASIPGTYKVAYTVKVNRPAYEEYMEQKAINKDKENSGDIAKEGSDDKETENAGTENAEETTGNGSEADLEEVSIEKNIEVVDQERAKELVEAGESVWTDENRDYGEILEEEKKAEESIAEKEVAENTQEKSEDSTQNNTDSSNTSGNNTSSSTGGSTEAGSNKTAAHTHNYTGTVTKAATCGSAGTKTYTCSCGASYTESIPATGNHNWKTTYTEKQVWVQDSAGYSQYVCKYPGCGYTTRDIDSIGLHNLDTGHTYKTQHVDATGHYETEKVASGSKCSVCGATK